MKFARKLCSLLLAVMMVAAICPVQAFATTTPSEVSAATAAQRVEKLRNFVKNNSHGYSYFTTTGKNCTSADSNHPSSNWCSYCVTTNLLNASWIKSDLGLLPSSNDQLAYLRWASPTEAASYGKIGVIEAPAYSCVGFAMIAHWFIYAQKSTDNIAGEHIATIDLSNSTSAKTNLEKYARVGDVLVYRTAKTNGNYRHAAIYTGCSTSGITVLDSNWGGSSGPTCKMQEHTIPYSSYRYVEITRATNASKTVTYTITYNANGGTNAPAAQTKTKDVSLTLSTTQPTRAGYNFLGWATSSSATSAQYQPGSTYTANANVTLYAVWEELNTIAINAANFPDANFRAVVSTKDKNGDGKLNEAEITAVTKIDCSKKNISSLKGIEYFTALTELRCDNNNLTALDVSKNTALERLDCYENQLTALDVSKNTALKMLSCHDNQLTTLDVSRNTALTYLSCGENQLTTLDVSRNTALTNLSCGGNQLTALDVSRNTALTNLDCCMNQLIALDVSRNTALTNLDCCVNQLIALDVSRNTALTSLSCWDNQLTTLDVSKNTALERLDCSNNRLTTLDVSKNTALTNLYCERNNLPSLNVSKNTALEILGCGINQLTTLDVSRNTALTELNCLGNQLTALDVSRNTALTKLECESNSYDITLNANRSYDLSKLPGSFDVSKAKAWNGCTIQGSVIKVNAGVNEVSYTYDCGNGRTMPVTLNVVGVEAPATYTVSYNANGGSGAPSVQTKTKDVSLTLSTTRPTREGYSFLGWATSSSAASAQYQPGSTYTANANVTLYAVWEELNTIAINEANFPDANFRAVVSTFDGNGDGKLN